VPGPGSVGPVRLLLSTSERFAVHDTRRGHPERPARLDAVLAGIESADVGDALVRVAPRAATRAELEGAHPPDFLDAMERFCASGGGAIDGDTAAVEASWAAAVLAAGAGPDAVERLDRGEADAAFCVVRPPGHHAMPARAMGFCLVNNVAVTAAALADRGERVLILDWDAHHGNGTQAVFYSDPRVLYVSLHEFPLYPFTGRLGETGAGDGVGTTLNLPLPAGLTGDVALAVMDEVVAPVVEAFAPSWLLVSAGFDGHRADPLTGLGLSSGDFADLTRRSLSFAPAGRRIAFLEGGYDLQALADSAGAFAAALVGEEHRPERATAGGPGRAVVDAALAALAG
jgi:acetoin utilization deacetylase AcuC-like enzyme